MKQSEIIENNEVEVVAEGNVLKQPPKSEVIKLLDQLRPANVFDPNSDAMLAYSTLRESIDNPALIQDVSCLIKHFIKIRGIKMEKAKFKSATGTTDSGAEVNNFICFLGYLAKQNSSLCALRKSLVGAKQGDNKDERERKKELAKAYNSITAIALPDIKMMKPVVSRRIVEEFDKIEADYIKDGLDLIKHNGLSEEENLKFFREMLCKFTNRTYANTLEEKEKVLDPVDDMEVRAWAQTFQNIKFELINYCGLIEKNDENASKPISNFHSFALIISDDDLEDTSSDKQGQGKTTCWQQILETNQYFSFNNSLALRHIMKPENYAKEVTKSRIIVLDDLASTDGQAGVIASFLKRAIEAKHILWRLMGQNAEFKHLVANGVYIILTNDSVADVIGQAGPRRFFSIKTKEKPEDIEKYFEGFAEKYNLIECLKHCPDPVYNTETWEGCYADHVFLDLGNKEVRRRQKGNLKRHRVFNALRDRLDDCLEGRSFIPEDEFVFVKCGDFARVITGRFNQDDRYVIEKTGDKSLTQKSILGELVADNRTVFCESGRRDVCAETGSNLQRCIGIPRKLKELIKSFDEVPVYERVEEHKLKRIYSEEYES